MTMTMACRRWSLIMMGGKRQYQILLGGRNLGVISRQSHSKRPWMVQSSTLRSNDEPCLALTASVMTNNKRNLTTASAGGGYSLYGKFSSFQKPTIQPSTSPTLLMTHRNFSAKNRERKEAKRKKRQEKKELQTDNTSNNPTKTTSDNANAKPIMVTQTKAATSSSTANSDPIIAAAPPDEEDEQFVSQFSMPDREKEKEILAMQQHVSQLYQQGQYQQGVKLAKEALQVTENHFSDLHPATGAAHVNVGLGMKHFGKFEHALKHYQIALETYRQTVGSDHASYALVLHNIGLLYQAQIHFDDTLQQTERLRLLELALDHLQSALEIRQVELPKEHPHIVATQSAIGALLTAHLLHQHKKVAAAGTTASRYVPVVPQRTTNESWTAAKQYLQQALDTALQHPRGDSSLKRTDKNHYLNIQKKQQLKAKMIQKDNSNEEESTATMIPPLQTKSAATAAQNLAVFYKARATTLDPKSPEFSNLTKQAQDLYQSALAVRQALLPKGHEDIYITQYSLAELYESTGQTEEAQALRQTILDTWGEDFQKSSSLKNT